MPTTLWDQPLPFVIGFAALVLPAAGAFAVAWLKAQTAALNVAKTAVSEVEAFAARPEIHVSSAEKRELALRKMHDANPALSRERASQLIERVLPDVKRESDRPTQPFEVFPPAGSRLHPRLDESASGLPTPPRDPPRPPPLRRR